MDLESYRIIRKLKARVPKDFATIVVVHPCNTYGVNDYQIGCCRSKSTPPTYREADPHWEFNLTWGKEYPMVVRQPDGSHAEIRNDRTVLRTPDNLIDFIVDVLSHDRIPETYGPALI